MRLAGAAVVPLFLMICYVQAAKPQLPQAADEREARALCGTGCHAYPPPDVLPRLAWPDTVARMQLLREGQPEPVVPRGTLAGKVILPEEMERVLAFYMGHAPPRLPAPAEWPAADAAAFSKRALAPGGVKGAPGISNVRFADLDGDGQVEVVATDMRHGLVLRGRPGEPATELAVIGKVAHPARAEPVDLDGDGLLDLLVADLGQFLPGDEEKGGAVWLRRRKQGEYEAHSFGNFPRVADVRGADFDRDGTLDLLVGAFGWRKVGHIALLQARGTSRAPQDFARRRIDERSGTVNVHPADLNGDGRLDFIALISQQHEQVVAFVNGAGGFTPHVIYAAPHPNWGSSGMDVADMDGDRDLDVVLAHGDTLDDGMIKPYHGVELLENRGTYPFVAHQLATLSGVHPVKAIDFDRDRDLDIVAGAFYPPTAIGATPSMPSLAWLEQISPGRFEKHTLEVGNPSHASLDAADFDRDGDVDLAIGNLSAGRDMAWVEIWENQTARQ